MTAQGRARGRDGGEIIAHVYIFHFTQDVQLGQSPKECTFAQWHLSVVEGANQQHDSVEYIMSFLIM